VLIPSYNEAKTIGPLVRCLRAKDLDVVVIDDGSLDQTAEIAQFSGAYILKHKKNKGKGASLKKGFRFILEKRKNKYDAIITMDGDGQHSPDDIPRFIERMSNSNADMVVGNRMLYSKGMPPIRWLTNRLMSFLLSLICHQNIPDSQCGFRLIKSSLLEQINLRTSNYEIESEIIVEASLHGFKQRFVPIQTIYTKQVSQINPVIDTIRFFKFIFKYFFSLLISK
jgi:glycosyltransferase involved in cell wall biosynthesis